jgi:hypothetical protein
MAPRGARGIARSLTKWKMEEIFRAGQISLFGSRAQDQGTTTAVSGPTAITVLFAARYSTL